MIKLIDIFNEIKVNTPNKTAKEINILVGKIIQEFGEKYNNLDQIFDKNIPSEIYNDRFNDNLLLMFNKLDQKSLNNLYKEVEEEYNRIKNS